APASMDPGPGRSGSPTCRRMICTRAPGAAGSGRLWSWGPPPQALPAGDGGVLAPRRHPLLGLRPVYVREAQSLDGVEVVEVAPELVEAVGGRQGLGVVTQVVLAELAGVVAEIAQAHLPTGSGVHG